MSINCQFLAPRIGPTGPTGPAGPLPLGTYLSDYLFYNPDVDAWEVGSEAVHLGRAAIAPPSGVAIGFGSEGVTGAVAIGTDAAALGAGAVAIGPGSIAQAENSIALGANAGVTGTVSGIVLNATGGPLVGVTGGFTVAPINTVTDLTNRLPLYYDTVTKEIVAYFLD